MSNPPSSKTPDIEGNIREIVRRDRERRGEPQEETVIRRFLTDEERQALASRDTRRPMDRLLEQSVGGRTPRPSAAPSPALPPGADESGKDGNPDR
jgi:hypothetical protein